MTKVSMVLETHKTYVHTHVVKRDDGTTLYIRRGSVPSHLNVIHAEVEVVDRCALCISDHEQTRWAALNGERERFYSRAAPYLLHHTHTAHRYNVRLRITAAPHATIEHVHREHKHQYGDQTPERIAS